MHWGFPFFLSQHCLIFILLSAAPVGFPVGSNEAVRQRQSRWARVAAKIQLDRLGLGRLTKLAGGGAPAFRTARDTRACRVKIRRSRGSWRAPALCASLLGYLLTHAAQGSEAEHGMDEKLNQAQSYYGSRKTKLRSGSLSEEEKAGQLPWLSTGTPGGLSPEPGNREVEQPERVPSQLQASSVPPAEDGGPSPTTHSVA